LSSIYS
ncbi:hypothetical protein D030_0227B, partial [Vibrio parahaemolyticus AQ3810]